MAKAPEGRAKEGFKHGTHARHVSHGPTWLNTFAFTGVTRTHASLRQLKENGAKTGSDGLSAEEGGGTGGARMQNRLFADAYLDAYLKNALFWGVGERRKAFWRTKLGFPPEQDHGKGVSDGLSRVRHP